MSDDKGLSGLEHKSFNLKATAAGDERVVELTGAVFGNVDHQNEVIKPGAFRNLNEFVKDGWIAVNHSRDDLPIASIEHAYQDGHGLQVTAWFHSHPAAEAARTVVRERLERGRPVKCSIGYRVIDDDYESRGGKSVRILTSLDLFEVSIVNLPANPLAGVTGMRKAPKSADPKSLDDPESRRAIINRLVREHNHSCQRYNLPYMLPDPANTAAGPVGAKWTKERLDEEVAKIEAIYGKSPNGRVAGYY